MKKAVLGLAIVVSIRFLAAQVAHARGFRRFSRRRRRVRGGYSGAGSAGVNPPVHPAAAIPAAGNAR